MKLWKIFCVLTASEGQMGPYGPAGYGPGPYGPRMGQMPMAGHGGHQVHPQQMGQGHHSDQNHGHAQVPPAPRYVPGQKNVPVRENNAVRRASIHENIHQGALCGKTLNYSLIPGDSRNLKSPKYPAGFSSQTQCVWQISSPPGTRIRVDFDVFQISATGRACNTVYLEFSSISMDVLGNEMPGAGGSFKLCGKNPGYIISQTNQMTVWLHADEAGMGMDQRFLLKLSVTREVARVLALNGNAIADGRPIGALAKRDPMPLGPAAGSVKKSSSGGPIMPFGSTRGGTIRSPSQVGTFDDFEADSGVGEEMEQGDNRMKNMAIMFLFIGGAISLIAGAVFIRRRIEKNNASEEEQNQSKEATKNQK